jgi:hypothetical protein
MRDLAALGNRGAGSPYSTRSHADFAIAVATFGRGYTPEEVASVLTDHSLGISEKAIEEGPNAGNYVGRTVHGAYQEALPADGRFVPPAGSRGAIAGPQRYPPS